MTENIVSRGFTQVSFVDQYGEERIIHRSHGTRLAVKKREDSVSHVLNRIAAEMMGDKIKAKRIERGLTLDGLLSKAGLAAGPGQGKMRMFEIERAGRNRSYGQKQGIRFGTLYALALALECDITELLPTPHEVAERAGVALIVPNTVRLSTAA